MFYATEVTTGLYAVRPVAQLGTCGYYPHAWTVEYVKARDPAAAIAHITRRIKHVNP